MRALLLAALLWLASEAAGAASYALIDQTQGVVVNIIEWDGVAPILPPAGQSIMQAPDGVGIGWFYGNGHFSPPAAPLPDPAVQMQALLVAGLTVQCAAGATVCTSAIEGTYSVDENSELHINNVYSSIKGGDGLPGGGQTFYFKDIHGIGHPFTAEQFLEFAPAARDFYYGASVAEGLLQAGQTASWPATAVQLP